MFWLTLCLEEILLYSRLLCLQSPHQISIHLHFHIIDEFSPITHTTPIPQLGFTTLPLEKPSPFDTALPEFNEKTMDESLIEEDQATKIAEDDQIMRDLHALLLETEVREGKMVCGNCGHEYRIKEGIANFLLPSHLGEFFFFYSSYWGKG